MKEQNKSAYIEYRLSRAEETFLAAQNLAKGKFWNSCVNRLYYACFYAANALLYADGIITKSHAEVKSQFLQSRI